MEKSCENCRFWSEMCARSIGCGPLEALCLSTDSPNRQKMTAEKTVCESWKHGYAGAVDAPFCHGYPIDEIEQIASSDLRSDLATSGDNATSTSDDHPSGG